MQLKIKTYKIPRQFKEKCIGRHAGTIGMESMTPSPQQERRRVSE